MLMPESNQHESIWLSYRPGFLEVLQKTEPYQDSVLYFKRKIQVVLQPLIKVTIKKKLYFAKIRAGCLQHVTLI